MANQDKILVTLGGECFRAIYIDKGHDGRDGVLYCFRLQDLSKDRGERIVSLFRSGSVRVFVENYDERIEIVRWNALRRAVDSGEVSFETAPLDKTQELSLGAAHFQQQKKASDQAIRRFIKFGAYFLGYKYRPNGISFVDFQCDDDVDYLGATTEDIGKNVWLLTQQGYLQSSAVSTLANPYRCTPTAQLIEEIENAERPQPVQSIVGGNVTHNFNIHGNNPRVNINSTDNSVNVVSVSGDQLFAKIREAAGSIGNDAERAEILSKLGQLERAQGSGGFLIAYRDFIACVADYMTIFGPFVPALTQMLSGVGS